MESVTISQAQSGADIAQARELFEEYAAWLGFSLCFQNFDQELATLPGKYAPPSGRLLVAHFEGALAACGALRRLETEVCEMKRLYVKPEFRGRGVGREIAERLIEEARTIGYALMRLDTEPQRMPEANRLYRELCFREIPAYYHNPRADVCYLELGLD
jgi:putative acetyltransferase